MECRLWFLLSLLVHLNLSIDQASFYGNSYISLPFKEAKSSTDVHFKFRTLLPNSLIILVAGSTDYCIVRLENGRLKVNINLGAGESELISGHYPKLNDFKWHQVLITRRDANLSMTIDNLHKFTKRLPGRFFELNIHYGLFVGGCGNFSEIFFGHLDNLRGCLSQLNYNGINVIEQARLRQSQSTVQHVTWNCATEFGATVDQPISFIEDDAFVLLSHRKNTDVRLKFDLKTMSHQAILFYNVPINSYDFLLMEIWKTYVRLIAKSDSSVELVNTNSNKGVSDGTWHKIFVEIASNIVRLVIDDNVVEAKINNTLIQLGEASYIGGLEPNKRSRAMSKGCKFCDYTLKGCIQNVALSKHNYGLPDVVNSNGILSGCLWSYPCLQEPCKDNGYCVQKGLDSFHCQCEDDFCIKLNYSQGYKLFSSLATHLELLTIEPLQVLEGENAVISTKNLHLVLDYMKFGIKDIGVVFSIAEGPLHGSVAISVWPKKNSFTLADVVNDKVHYIHDGSEFHQDVIVLEVEFIHFSDEDISFILPEYLQGRFRFSLSINVVPVNDIPRLVVSEDSVLRVVEGTRKVIDNKIFKTDDPDSTPPQIVYTILSSDSGHFENVHKSSNKITSFTQKQVDDKEIVFVHNPQSNDSFITLQASDGIETSPSSKIRIAVTPQYWRLENNTGLTVLHQSATVITPFNLSFTSNAENDYDIENRVQVNIVKKPSHGVVEFDRNSNDKWESASHFFLSDLRQHRVRYRHSTGTKPDLDEFEFRLNVRDDNKYTFRITFVKCSIVDTSTNSLVLNEDNWNVVLSSKYLSFQTRPIKVQTTSIHYIVSRTPKYGHLISSQSNYKMRSCDKFTQEDVDSMNIKYKFRKRPYSSVNDSFQLVIISPGCSNVTRNYTVTYFPPTELTSRVNVQSKKLLVDEGSNGKIDHSHLSVNKIDDDSSELQFNVTEEPQCGFLDLIDNIDDKILHFRFDDIQSGRVYYVHDGSECDRDHFKFVILTPGESSSDFMYVGDFYIDISLKNDNSPVRSVDQIFNVVVGGDRLLTGHDLKYTDQDLDTQTKDIVYSIRESPTNGNFYLLPNNVKTSEFTQHDLDTSKVLFRHKGAEYAKVRLWVTDGQFHVNGVLEIQASAPFIQVRTLKKLIVKQGGGVVITNNELTYSTNVLTMSNSDVVYEITKTPTFGRVIANDQPVTNFTQDDVDKGHVSYVNTNDIGGVNADEIGLRVKCRDAVNVGQIGVLLLPSNYWKPLKIRRLDRVLVEESTSGVISRNIVEIVQDNVPPSAIHYHLKELPENGYISVFSDDNDPKYVTHFSQDLVNENRILYIQSVSNQTEDKAVFNVTNGIIWLNNIVLSIEIIPERIFLKTTNVSVDEGVTTALTLQNVVTLTSYYKSKIKEYLILQDPLHGCLQIHKKCTKFNSFTHKELVAGLVNFAHDGSENLVDEIRISAVTSSGVNSRKKSSVPASLFINVRGVNDQKPILVNNTGITMWEGGEDVITRNILAATDADRPGDTLQYQVSAIWRGIILVKNSSSQHCNIFTQQLIDDELLIFRHLNGSDAKFTFNVTDGVHTTKEFTFHVKTKPVELKLIKSKNLHIFPLQRKYLTSSHLTATVSDPNREIYYDVIAPPTLGRLMRESSSQGFLNQVSTFTQSDLNNSEIFYEHTHQFFDLYANDSFVFCVKSHLARTLRNQLLRIDISVSSGGLDAYVSIPKITVDEGGVTTVAVNLSGVTTFLENHAGLGSPIIHASAISPQHGDIFLKNNRNVSVFTQQQLETGQVFYEHDHSDTLGDNVYFSLYLIPGYITLCNVTVPIVVNPINDQPFTLVTPAPSLRVVQGQNSTITRVELATEDLDTPPSKIKYDVISGPNYGRLLLLPDHKNPMFFSQEDIDSNLLVYVHNSSVLKDSFHFRVWDGKFRPQFTLFNIIVIPVNLTVLSHFPVLIQQGSDVVFLSEHQFAIDTNADKDRVDYFIKQQPKHGTIYVKDLPTPVQFTQVDLRNDAVMYLQSDMTVANDCFSIFAQITSGNASMGNQVDVTVKVQPFMQSKNFTAISGKYNKITTEYLDATPLAKLTNSNPRFSVIHLPKFSHIRRVIRSSGEKRNIVDTTTNSFTHEEIQSGLIYLVVDDVDLPVRGISDKLEFLLASTIFQPAVGEVRVEIRSKNSMINNEIGGPLAGPNDPASHEGGLHFASPNMTRDYFLIDLVRLTAGLLVSMVVGVVVLGIAVIVIIKCRSLELDELNKEAEFQQPMPLPRPPDRLPKSHNNDSFAPTPMPLPHCKVTPIRGDSEHNACYPYGADEHSDDWSSCDASDPASLQQGTNGGAANSKNVMLRRNQYWV